MTGKTYTEVKQIVAACAEAVSGPFAYYQFPMDQEEGQDPPFLVYYYPRTNDLIADNGNYAAIKVLIIELYTEDKDFAAEAAVEAVLAANEIPHDKTEAYIDSEKMWQITYTTEVIINVRNTL